MSLKFCSLPLKNISLLQRGSSLSQTASVTRLTRARTIIFKKSERLFPHNLFNSFLRLSSRNFSIKLPDLSSNPIQGPAKPHKQSAFDQILKLSPTIDDRRKSLSNESRAFLKKVRPSLEENKNDWVRALVRSFPQDTDPAQLLNDFTKKIGSKGIDIVTYNRLIHIFSLDGNFLRAQSIFDLMLRNNIPPNERTYCALMNAYSNGGELTKTIEIFKLLKNDSKLETPHAYAILIKAYMKHNRVQDAFDVVTSMKQKTTPDITTYTTLIQTCIKANANDRAWAAYEMMLSDGVLPSVVTYTMLISICRKADVKKALQLFEELLDRGIPPTNEVVTSLLSALCSEPEFYPKAIGFAHVLSSQGVFRPNAVAFTIMIRGAITDRNLTAARRFFYQSQQIECDPKDQLSLYSSMFEAYASSFAVNQNEQVLIPSKSIITSDFSFLNDPTPKCINDCVNEAMKLLPFFKKFDLTKETPSVQSRPWASFLSILTTNNYFDEAMKWFKTISKKFQHRLPSHFYLSMLTMCTRIHKEEAFFVILKKTDPLLTPVRPGSSLSEVELNKHRQRFSLSPESLEELYKAIIIGCSEFNYLTEALNYFELATKDPTIDWKKNEIHYQPFFKAIENATDLVLKKQLNDLL